MLRIGDGNPDPRSCSKTPTYRHLGSSYLYTLHVVVEAQVRGGFRTRAGTALPPCGGVLPPISFSACGRRSPRRGLPPSSRGRKTLCSPTGSVLSLSPYRGESTPPYGWHPYGVPPSLLPSVGPSGAGEVSLYRDYKGLAPYNPKVRCWSPDTSRDGRRPSLIGHIHTTTMVVVWVHTTGSRDSEVEDTSTHYYHGTQYHGIPWYHHGVVVVVYVM